MPHQTLRSLILFCQHPFEAEGCEVARHGHVDRDLVAESIPTIERELADVYAAAREMTAELGRIGADSLVEGSPCRS